MKEDFGSQVKKYGKLSKLCSISHLGMCSGGLDEDIERIRTTEIFAGGAFSPGPDLPEPLTSHCMFWLNETHIAVTGGWGDNSSAVLSAYLFNINNEEWTKLGDTILRHYRHGCGMVDIGDGE